ncbi:MAG: hypothetical protein J5806_07075 [Lentisphaeria bacterium]|nr:hypothetical protein [Lentisphaeria bacterium]
MGTISIIICGLIGAGSASKQSFLTGWIFLVNFSIALYSAIFLAPLAVALLEIPGCPAGIKNAAAVGGITIVLFIILKKVCEQIFPGTVNALQLPAALEKIASVCSGLLSGFLVGGLILYIIVQLFPQGVIPEPMGENIRNAGSNTLRNLIGTVNVLSFQSLTPAGEDDLRVIGLLPKPELKEKGKDREKDKAAGDKQEETKKPEEAKKKAPPRKTKIVMVPGARQPESKDAKDAKAPKDPKDR